MFCDCDLIKKLKLYVPLLCIGTVLTLASILLIALGIARVRQDVWVAGILLGIVAAPCFLAGIIMFCYIFHPSNQEDEDWIRGYKEKKQPRMFAFMVPAQSGFQMGPMPVSAYPYNSVGGLDEAHLLNSNSQQSESIDGQYYNVKHSTPSQLDGRDGVGSDIGGSSMLSQTAGAYSQQQQHQGYPGSRLPPHQEQNEFNYHDLEPL